MLTAHAAQTPPPRCDRDPRAPLLRAADTQAELVHWRSDGAPMLTLVCRLGFRLDRDPAELVTRPAPLPLCPAPFKVQSDVIVAPGGQIEASVALSGARMHVGGAARPLGPLSLDMRRRALPVSTGAAGEDLGLGWRSGFDPRFWNAAPPEQRIDRALLPDERIEVELCAPAGALAGHNRWSTRLPGVRCFAFAETLDGMVSPIALTADTLWLDLVEQRGVVEYRGPILAGAHQVFVAHGAGEAPSFERIRGLATGKISPELMALAFDTVAAAGHAALPALPFAPHSAPPPPIAHRPIIPAPPRPLPPAPQRIADDKRAALEHAAQQGAAAVSLEAAREQSPGFDSSPPVVRRRVRQRRDDAVVDLLWHASEGLSRLGGKAAGPLDEWLNDPGEVADPALRERRRIVNELMTAERAAPSALGQTLLDAADAGRAQPMVCCEAELSLSHPPRALLEQMVELAKLHAAHKRVAEALEIAAAALSSGWLSDRTAESLCQRVGQACVEATRASADELAAEARRPLLEARRYLERRVLGGPHIRALLRDGDQAVVAYLPAVSAEALPLSTRCRVRILGELRLRQDEREEHPVCLRVLALAAVVERTTLGFRGGRA